MVSIPRYRFLPLNDLSMFLYRTKFIGYRNNSLFYSYIFNNFMVRHIHVWCNMEVGSFNAMDKGTTSSRTII